MNNLTGIVLLIIMFAVVIIAAIMIHRKWKDRLKWTATYSQSNNNLPANFNILKWGTRNAILGKSEVFESRYFNRKKASAKIALAFSPNSCDSQLGTWWLTPANNTNADFLNSAINNKAPVWLQVFYTNPPVNHKLKKKWIKAKYKG